jgi:hypothetical protein
LFCFIYPEENKYVLAFLLPPQPHEFSHTLI